jgi:ABC-type branched-subunit amino acid transport system substrate-binding protein
MKRKGCWIVLALSVALLSGCAAPKRQTTPADIPPSALNAPAPQAAEALWKQAEQEQNTGNITSAIAKYETIAQSYPNNAIAARALARLGNISLEQQHVDQSLKYFDYLLYMYPQWEGNALAQVDRLRALRLKGEKREVMKQGLELWKSSSNYPTIQFPLSILLANVYQDSGERSTALDWLLFAATKAETSEQQQTVAQATLDIVGGMDEPSIRKLMARDAPELIQVVLEYRLAQIERERGQTEQARERLTALLTRSATHPLAPQVRQALGETPTAINLPINPDRVGCLVPLSGPHESYGRMVMRGLAMAAEEWNETHPDQPVNLVVKDTQAQPEIAAKALEGLAKEYGVLAGVGLLSKQSTEFISPVVSQLSMPLLTMTQKEDAASNPFIFHVFLDKESMVKTLVRYCREKLGYTNFAALYPNGRYGESLQNVFEKVVQESGGRLTASVPYEPNSTDFRDPIQKLIQMSNQGNSTPDPGSMPFDALFIPDESQTVALIAPQLPYYNLVGITLLGTNIWGEAPPINEVGGVYVEKAIFATPFYAESKSPNVRKFIEKFQSLYQSSPSYLEAQAYDAMKLLLYARSRLPRSSMLRPALLQNILQIKGYDGVTGTMSITPAGEVDRSYLLLQVQQGGITQIAP